MQISTNAPPPPSGDPHLQIQVMASCITKGRRGV